MIGHSSPCSRSTISSIAWRASCVCWGPGKAEREELIAQAIHNLGFARFSPFVLCAVGYTETRIEAELYRHERVHFTVSVVVTGRLSGTGRKRARYFSMR